MASIDYVGLDVHKKTISYCVKTAGGRVLSAGEICATRQAVREWAQARERPWVGLMEATLVTGWLNPIVFGKQALGEMPGIKVYPTEANFFLIEVPIAPRAVFDELFKQGILIRDVSSYPMLSKCLRISVGTREENDRLLSALRASLT